MKHLFFTVIVGFISFGSCLLLYQKLDGDGFFSGFDLGYSFNIWDTPAASANGSHRNTEETYLRAPGKLEGKTETIELRARISEQIVEVRATKGKQVSEGDVLIRLDAESLIQECDLAKALLEMAAAKKLRLENGARTSEIEAAKQEYEANLSPLWSAERALARGIKLFEGTAAISQQSLDELRSNVDSIRARAAAAEARLTTLKLPARPDDLSVANADVHAAEARLKIAQINLQRAELRAPIDGQILQVNAKTGELTGPDSPAPMIVMVDTSQLHAIAEVDEFDALSVRLGQQCEITSDAWAGILAVGKVVEIEPQMQPKKMFGQWAGERNDSFSRRVKIALQAPIDLPIGLPIEVAIQATGNNGQ